MNETAVQKSKKGFVPTLLLALFLGGLGIHRIIMIAVGAFKDKAGLPIKA
jgi:TM2 domain-containing membrane protein YozV